MEIKKFIKEKQKELNIINKYKGCNYSTYV
jgi:hypothetical protein